MEKPTIKLFQLTALKDKTTLWPSNFEVLEYKLVLVLEYILFVLVLTVILTILYSYSCSELCTGSQTCSTLV